MVKVIASKGRKAPGRTDSATSRPPHSFWMIAHSWRASQEEEEEKVFLPIFQ